MDGYREPRMEADKPPQVSFLVGFEIPSLPHARLLLTEAKLLLVGSLLSHCVPREAKWAPAANKGFPELFVGSSLHQSSTPRGLDSS